MKDLQNRWNTFLLKSANSTQVISRVCQNPKVRKSLAWDYFGQMPIVFPSQQHQCTEELECGPMPNVMDALQNISGTLYSTPLLECRAVTLPRCETRWNLQGCPKLPDRSQPLVGLSLPYCEDTCRRHCRLTSLFRLSIRALVAKTLPDEVVWWCTEGDFLAIFYVLYFQRAACSTFQTCIRNSH